ncbi:uncharacterized protein LOC141642896 [Silene latifolia]|uniref:uncharacterized protein LOC141642896 n=1 Tax=Silene latifolia TaxID=37657 RepID=UPI003D7758E0
MTTSSIHGCHIANLENSFFLISIGPMNCSSTNLLSLVQFQSVNQDVFVAQQESDFLSFAGDRCFEPNDGDRCFHSKGLAASCMFSNNPYMIGLEIFEIFSSQIPNFHKLTFLSTIAAIMSFGYVSIGILLSLAQIIAGKGGKTTLTGVEIGVDITAADNLWTTFRALGDIVFTYSYGEPPSLGMTFSSSLGVRLGLRGTPFTANHFLYLLRAAYFSRHILVYRLLTSFQHLRSI